MRTLASYILCDIYIIESEHNFLMASIIFVFNKTGTLSRIRLLLDEKNSAKRFGRCCCFVVYVCSILNILSSHFDVMKLKSQKKRAFFGIVKLMGIMMNS